MWKGLESDSDGLHLPSTQQRRRPGQTPASSCCFCFISSRGRKWRKAHSLQAECQKPFSGLNLSFSWTFCYMNMPWNVNIALFFCPTAAESNLDSKDRILFFCNSSLLLRLWAKISQLTQICTQPVTPVNMTFWYKNKDDIKGAENVKEQMKMSYGAQKRETKIENTKQTRLQIHIIFTRGDGLEFVWFFYSSFFHFFIFIDIKSFFFKSSIFLVNIWIGSYVFWTFVVSFQTVFWKASFQSVSV